MTTMTWGALAVSVSVRARPSFSGIPSVLKRPSLTVRNVASSRVSAAVGDSPGNSTLRTPLRPLKGTVLASAAEDTPGSVRTSSTSVGERESLPRVVLVLVSREQHVRGDATVPLKHFDEGA
nr:hypothetical protein [Myxococcus sp. AM011]